MQFLVKSKPFFMQNWKIFNNHDFISMDSKMGLYYSISMWKVRFDAQKSALSFLKKFSKFSRLFLKIRYFTDFYRLLRPTRRLRLCKTRPTADSDFPTFLKKQTDRRLRLFSEKCLTDSIKKFLDSGKDKQVSCQPVKPTCETAETYEPLSGSTTENMRS